MGYSSFVCDVDEMPLFVAGTMYGRVYCFDLQNLKTPDASDDVSRKQTPPIIGKWHVGNEVVHLQSFVDSYDIRKFKYGRNNQLP